mmetsp:Transcript_36871/g.53900  ORF Transcript_36871/g.53900 Transcript_36871/m.53900 type:complete len:135 (-) Transcript_36871:516-920(-)
MRNGKMDQDVKKDGLKRKGVCVLVEIMWKMLDDTQFMKIRYDEENYEEEKEMYAPIDDGEDDYNEDAYNDKEEEEEDYYEQKEKTDKEESALEKKLKSKMQDELYKLDYTYQQVEANDYGFYLQMKYCLQGILR